MTRPQNLLQDIYWSCGKKRYNNSEAFGVAIAEYRTAIAGSDEGWTPDAVAFGGAALQISFWCWDVAGEHQFEGVLDLSSDHPEHFTTVDLLFKVCDGIAAYLTEHERELYDHCFFEGLSLSGTEGNSPLYRVCFGS